MSSTYLGPQPVKGVVKKVASGSFRPQKQKLVRQPTPYGNNPRYGRPTPKNPFFVPPENDREDKKPSLKERFVEWLRK